MNKNNLFLTLMILLCANQASAGWFDTIQSGFQDAGAWVISKLPESWQGRACIALGICTILGASYLMKRSSQKTLKQQREEALNREYDRQNKWKENNPETYDEVSPVQFGLENQLLPYNEEVNEALIKFKDDDLIKAYIFYRFNKEDNAASEVKEIYINRAPL